MTYPVSDVTDITEDSHSEWYTVLCPICNHDLGKVRRAEFALTRIEYHVAESHPGYCPCGELIENHNRCIACGSYTGISHFYSHVEYRDGKPYCPDCAAHYDRDPNYMKKHQIFVDNSFVRVGGRPPAPGSEDGNGL